MFLDRPRVLLRILLSVLILMALFWLSLPSCSATPPSHAEIYGLLLSTTV